MNRKEQILDAAADHRDWVCCGFIDPVADAREESFAKGAEWADKTMIDKACRWLDQQLFIKYDSDAVTRFINDFRKSMEK